MNWLLKILSLLILITIVTIFQSCWIGHKELINVTCNSDCTTIHGKFTLADGSTPVKDAWLELNWRSISGPGFFFGGQRRKIATTRTDDNGSYIMTFYARDDELTYGFFEVDYKVPDDSYMNTPTSSFRMYGINKRDTLIEFNFNLPKKGSKINFRIKNPGDIGNSESLICNISFRFGNRNSYMLEVVGQLDSDFDSEGTYETAADQFTHVLITKQKDGQYVEYLDSLFIPFNETKIYEAEF